MASPHDQATDFRFALSEDISRIVELDQRYLPDDTIVPAAVFRSWHERNPAVFTCLLVDGEIAGYYSLLPLSATALSAFVAGTRVEKDFVATDIVAPDATTGQSASLYFYSIVLDAPQRPLLGEMLRRLAGQIRDYRQRQPVQRIYATAATAAGRRLLERLGFTYLAAGETRADRHDLYVLDDEAIRQLAPRVAKMNA